MNRESHYAYMKRRMREQDELEGIKQIESNLQLQKRVDKLEEQLSKIIERQANGGEKEK